jgi:hypothetical protein
MACCLIKRSKTFTFICGQFCAAYMQTQKPELEKEQKIMSKTG